MSSSTSTSKGTSTGNDSGSAAGNGLALKLVGAWTFVGIPLAYGIYQTVNRASALFTS